MAKDANAKASFQWDDPFLLEDQLSEEEKMIRDTARNYAQESLAARVKSAFREERFDREIMTEMGESRPARVRPSRTSTAAPASTMSPMA